MTNKPAVSAENKLIVPATTDKMQDYLEINVTLLAKDMLVKGNEGFEIKHTNESAYKITCLTTSDSRFPKRRPKLVIKYSLP